MLYEPSIFNDKISLLSQFEALKQYVIGFSPEGGVAVADYEFTLTHVIPDTIPKIAGNLITTYVNGNKATAPFEFPFAIKGSETIVVDVDENTEALEIHLDSDIVSKLQRAVVIPVSKPSSISLFAVDTTGAQTMITLGEGLTIEDGVLKVTSAVEPETKTTTATFYQYVYSSAEGKYVYEKVGTYTTTSEDPYISIDYYENDGTSSIINFSGETILDGTAIDNRKIYNAEGTELIDSGGTYSLTQGETYTFYVLFANDTFVPPTSGATTTVNFYGLTYNVIDDYYTRDGVVVKTIECDDPYIYFDYTNVRLSSHSEAVSDIEVFSNDGDWTITQVSTDLAGNNILTNSIPYTYDLTPGNTYDFYINPGAEVAPTTATFYLLPYGGTGPYENLGTFTTTLSEPYIRIHDEDGSVGSYSAVDFGGQEVFEGSAVDNLYLYEADGTRLTYFDEGTVHRYPLEEGETYTFYLVYNDDDFLDPTATVTVVNLYAPYGTNTSGEWLYKWTTTKTENLILYVDSMQVAFSDDEAGDFGLYMNGNIEILGLSKTSGGDIFLQPDQGITITAGTTNTFYLVYEERALPITTLKLWATDGDLNSNERTLHTYITTEEEPYLYGDSADGAGAGVRFGAYNTTEYVYTSAWYSLEGFSAYESGDPVWQPAYEWIHLQAGATYELYTIEN